MLFCACFGATGLGLALSPPCGFDVLPDSDVPVGTLMESLAASTSGAKALFRAGFMVSSSSRLGTEGTRIGSTQKAGSNAPSLKLQIVVLDASRLCAGCGSKLEPAELSSEDVLLERASGLCVAAPAVLGVCAGGRRPGAASRGT
mmetsp:Transcript_109100/g.178099  ORF Transcript_109100/g.178099 Transcript_109100/m.178099 type:complete len:145 (+) Transcript_109100:844-1278(+)